MGVITYPCCQYMRPLAIKSSMLIIVVVTIVIILRLADIGKSTGPQSSTGENGGGLMKTLTVPVLLSGKKIPLGSPSMGTLT